ncbi:MAG: peptide chain release factor N(5)-glutamine methyltransferase [Clostridium sp.]|nr:peptide chain release factor N(5)-glutamine methyltransferase [Clostridium sp.]
MLLRDMLKNGTDRLKACGIENAEGDARLLAMHVLGMDYTRLFMELDKNLEDEAVSAYNGLIEKRGTHYPCQYMIGTQDFMGYTFAVSEHVLIPRPETELLVEQALRAAGDKGTCNVLDMCCGTGCIGISYILERRKRGNTDDRLTLVDISPYAVRLSENNSFLHDISCDIIKSDMFEYKGPDVLDAMKVKNSGDLYDIIMTNPPYIKSSDIDALMEEVSRFEPRLALDGMEDGLYFYRRIIKEARNYLSENGCFICEIGYNQYDAVYSLLVDNGYSDIELTRDYAGLDRVVLAYMRDV